jgi:hypothetical protein
MWTVGSALQSRFNTIHSILLSVRQNYDSETLAASLARAWPINSHLIIVPNCYLTRCPSSMLARIYFIRICHTIFSHVATHVHIWQLHKTSTIGDKEMDWYLFWIFFQITTNFMAGRSHKSRWYREWPTHQCHIEAKTLSLIRFTEFSMLNGTPLTSLLVIVLTKLFRRSLFPHSL